MNNNSLFKVRGGWMLPAFFTTLLLLCVTVCSAQTVPISGTITDAQGSLPSVNVQIKNKAISTVTDANGNFEIQASPEDTLIVSSMGYLTIEMPVGSRTTFNLTLVEDATALEEVTVNAGYYKVKDRERTGSIATIKAADIELQPVSSPLAAMQGRMAGVNITQASGVAGGGFSIQIRGINSLRAEGNDPLYIVDGVPYASQSLGNSSLTNGVMTTTPSPLNNINPSDIEAIEVLKDADATAIYGSRGANGVVLITTKKGKAGKTTFKIQSSSTVGHAISGLKVLKTPEYLRMREEAFANDGYTEYPVDAYDINGTWSKTRNTDWKKELIGGTSYVQNVQGSISGGSADTQFLLGGTIRNESTVTPDDGQYRKGVLHSSITHRTKDNRFSINFSADYSSDKNTLPGVDLSSHAYLTPPNAPALFDGNGNLNWENGTFQNPLANLESSYISMTNNLIINTTIAYKLFWGLDAKVSVGLTDTQLTENKTLPSTRYNPIYNATAEYSELLKNNATRKSWIAEPQLNWKKKLGSLELTALAGATLQSQNDRALGVYATGFPSNALINNLSAAKNIIILNDNLTEYRYTALFGRVNINYDERYILNITGRRDGSSRFGSGNRFANFGAFGAAWIFSKENFLLSQSLLSFGKIRASFGTTGNDQIGDYQYLDSYSITPNIYDGTVGLQPSRLFNPHFGWETNQKTEGAVELGFFQDRIHLSTAFYKNQSSNQLVGIPLATTTGFSSVQSNLAATVQNKGFELEIRSNNIRGKDLNWTTSLNFSKSKNTLLEYPNLDGSVYANTFIIGKSLGIQKLYHYTGIDNNTGTYTFEDVNGDGQLSRVDQTILVDFSPEFFGGLANTVSYKNWNLDFLFQFVKQKGYSPKFYFPAAGLFFNQPTTIINHFPESTNSDAVQQYTSGINSDVFYAQDYYTQSDKVIVDASYIRLKSISIDYRLPTEWSKSFTANIYLQGQNLLTLSTYNGVDPEARSIYNLPPLKQFTMGIQLKF